MQHSLRPHGINELNLHCIPDELEIAFCSLPLDVIKIPCMITCLQKYNACLLHQPYWPSDSPSAVFGCALIQFA